MWSCAVIEHDIIALNIAYVEKNINIWMGSSKVSCLFFPVKYMVVQNNMIFFIFQADYVNIHEGANNIIVCHYELGKKDIKED